MVTLPYKTNMSLNKYDQQLSKKFQGSDTKPDKQYSFLPTIFSIIGNIEGTVILDLGCGDGFFTRALASQGVQQVIGIDNSTEQLKLAEKKGVPTNIIYQHGDIFQDKLPKADIVLTPFVANYAENIDDLDFLIKSIYESLHPNGQIVLVVDLPDNKNLKKFGSLKTLEGPKVDGTKIKIDLYNNDEIICTLFSHYYTPQTLEATLSKNGFKNIKWYKPIISDEGLEKYGSEFWEGFVENSELGYLSAIK